MANNQWGFNGTVYDTGTLWVTPPVQINTLLFISGIHQGTDAVTVYASGEYNTALRTRRDADGVTYGTFGIRWLVLNT